MIRKALFVTLFALLLSFSTISVTNAQGSGTDNIDLSLLVEIIEDINKTQRLIELRDCPESRAFVIFSAEWYFERMRCQEELQELKAEIFLDELEKFIERQADRSRNNNDQQYQQPQQVPVRQLLDIIDLVPPTAPNANPIIPKTQIPWPDLNSINTNLGSLPNFDPTLPNQIQPIPIGP